MISLEERYQNFKETIKECGCYLLLESNDIIENNLFEEFSVDVVSFLHEDTLNKLLDEGMINIDILEKSIELRKCYLQMEKNSDLLNVEAVKTSEEWKKILKLSDEIRELFYW